MSGSAGELSARYYDGRTSCVIDVRIARTGDALRLASADGGTTMHWPLSEIVISPRLGATPRILRRAGHGHLEVADTPELGVWFARPPSRIEAFADFLERRRSVIALAALLIVVATVGFVRWGVPWVAQRAAERMSRQAEEHLSRQVVAMLDRLYFRPTKLDPARRQRIEHAFAAMVRNEPRAQEMRLAFVDAPALGPNAFALPDGRLYMTDQLVRLGGSDEELLSVFAHEAGHHVHRHGMRQAIESSSVFLAVGLLFGDVSGSSVAVAMPAALLSNGFSRGHEREADAYAIDLLRRTGHSQQAFAAMMRRLAKVAPEGEAGGAMGYLSTHPHSQERIEAAERAEAP